ncbi:MAG: glycosyltransferase [Planctomycetes bacterium]|nr:glycosyltransferase [Planctomycetota bacterium]
MQHLAGNRPLVLGEYGLDTIREGEQHQADLLEAHLREVHRRGLGGSYVFAFTDEWFTGGHDIDNWAFGVTRRDRSEKPAADRLERVWSRLGEVSPAENLPKVSVVVCSYNGARTLHECLDSLMRLNYPDYEVILVDDGSTDRTPEIAREFPQVKYIGQSNRGLSAARNVGAAAADGEIVAYTDDDCVAHEDWLLYLVRGMQDQNVAMIGGPNISPPSDGWTARCVAASPGNPSHVMFDDRLAEHVPGCNLAVQREMLFKLGGFDERYRAAGDDVDICWRFLDAGCDIGFAPGAFVWHHRRSTARAYLKQQKGYGRAEGMVQFKHPARFSRLGRSRWNGVIYGEGAVGLPVLSPRIYHGRFGAAPFQTVYQSHEYSPWSWVRSLEWHAIAALFLALAVLWPPLVVAVGGMWSLTLGNVVYCAWKAPLMNGGPWWCRPLVGFFYLAQPIVRSWHRVWWRLKHKGLLPPRPSSEARAALGESKRIAANVRDLYWDNREARGREQLLEALDLHARRDGRSGDFHCPWSAWDVKLTGDVWHNVAIRTATEELGWPRRFTRARWTIEPTRFAWAATIAIGLWSAAAVAVGSLWGCSVGLTLAVSMAGFVALSRRRLHRHTAGWLSEAAASAALIEEQVVPAQRAAQVHPQREAAAEVLSQPAS